ncbi:DMT family transporter [Streptomyces europaeiscabiei]|uniref:DMT family transporter n=1 Tax=Streptomyces europaeiscabiei TaxID=146819 RepID=UPI0029B0D327|nr:EamA family transporter [Streptomyces europaeiscabiei]MDX3612157.1 EamA family transporter [Streptomyces europaeiscabiei]WUD30955.1 EamA family transporter [Streptomyces europaeiscabiei]
MAVWVAHGGDRVGNHSRRSQLQSSSALAVRQGVLYVAIAATAWGTGGAVAAELYDVGGIGPISVSFWRFLTGLGLLLTVHLVRRTRRPETALSLRATYAANPRRALLTGFGLAVYQTAYFASVQQAGLTVATVVTLGSGPVLVTVGARLTLGERTGAAGTAAVVSGVIGLVLLMGGADGSTGPAPLLGIGYALLSAVGYAGVTLLGRFSGRKNAGGAFEATVTGFAVGTVCLLPMALLEGMLPDMERGAWTLGLILYLGAVPTALAYTLFFVGLAAVRATTASVVALVEPLTAAVIGVLVFDERLNAVVLTGTALLLFAVLFLAAGEGAGRAATRRTLGPDAGHGRNTSHPATQTKD